MAPSESIQIVQDQQHFDKLVNETKGSLIVVDFWATWCGPCKMIAPVFEKLAVENKDVLFLKVDVDELPEVAASQNIEAMPTFKFYKDGASVYTMKGANPPILTNLVKSLKPKV